MSYGAKTVSSTAALIIDGNVKRKGFFITNNSSRTVFIGPDNNVTVDNGVPIYQYQHLSKDKIPEGWLGPIYAISASEANVRYWEFET